MKNTIIKPVITEKSIALANTGKYTFIVHMDSDKPSIKRDIESTFSVKVLGIVTLIIKGKTKRVGQRRAEKDISAIKKAVVRLEAGQKIDLFEIAG